MSFPLYNNLNNNKKNNCKKDISVKQKKEFISFTTTIDENGAELIYALIKSYYNDKATLPHVCKENNNRYESNFELFPIKLKHMLIEFMTMHNESLIR